MTKPSDQMRRPTALLLSVLIVAALGPSRLTAEVVTSVNITKEVVTLSTQAHPKKTKLSYMVTERSHVNEVHLQYTLDRWNYGPVELQDGGKMTVTLEILAEDGTRILRSKKKTKCEARLWEDDFGSYNQRECFVGWSFDSEQELRAGDLVLWTIKFKKMPRLEFEPIEDTVYRDRYWLSGGLIPSF
jgi:hypothetical protein